MAKYYTYDELVSLLGVSRHRLSYAVLTGQVPSPKRKIGRKHVFDREAVEKFADNFGVDCPNWGPEGDNS